MTGLLKRTLTVVLLSSVAVMPAATLALVATADAAMAKSDKAGGKGKGNAAVLAGKSSKSQAGTSRGKSGSRNGGIDGLFAKLTGKERRSASAAAKFPEGSLHPSQLGNMNGALHANENAILAHIRNGNTNGPVGMMAALAAADYRTADARALLDSNLAADYAALDALAQDKGYLDYEDYLAAGMPDVDIDTLAGNIGKADYDEALGDYADFDAYLLAAYGDGSVENPGDPALVDPDLETLHANVGVYDQATADGFHQAAADSGEYTDAMDAMVDYWNKGDVDSENADALRDMLEARIAQYENVGETVDAIDAESAAAPADVCPAGEVCEAEVVVVAE